MAYLWTGLPHPREPRPRYPAGMLHRLLTAALLAGLAAPASAATYDPDLTWRTIVTEHFRIHFHQGEEQLAEEFSHTVEEIYDTMVDELAWVPRRRTHVVLIDRTDAANGFAQSVPYNAITIFVTGPGEGSQLADYEDWFTGIQTHEFTHTLHIDTNHGVARAARWAVGRISSTNRLSPAWMVEGLATFQETRHTNGGRGRTPVVEMILRTAALEREWPRLGRMDGFQAQPPSGAIRYLFGQDFIQHVADHHGPEVWTRWIHTYGSSVPYLLPGRFVLGGPLHRLHRDWRRDRLHQARAVVAELHDEAPLTRAELVSSELDSCRAPAYAPSGDRLVWSCASPRFGNQIWTADPDGSNARVLIQDRGASRITFRPDGQAFAYAGTHIVNRFNTWSDLYLYDLQSESVRALTSGARARDPAFSPDGQRLFMVTNAVQDNQLEVATVDRSRRALTAFTDHTQISTPVVHPDGGLIAASVWRHGRRDLWLMDADDGSLLRRLTLDDAIEREPRWSADGEWLYFASDRSGIPQVYAVELATERLWQVTHVATGAVHPAPSPDGTRIAWQEYHARGWRIAVHPIDRTTWLDRGLLPRPLVHGTPIAELRAERATATRSPLTLAPFEGEDLPRRRRPGVPIDPVADDLPGVVYQPPVTRGALPALAFPQSAGGTDSFDQAEVEDAFGEEQDYPFTIAPTRYTPLGALVPRYWVPFVQTTIFPSRKPFEGLNRLGGQQGFGLFASASTGSVDPLRHYTWSAGLNYSTSSGFLGGGASFTLNRWLPVYSLSAVRGASSPAPIFVTDPEDPEGRPIVDPDGRRYWQTTHAVSASVNYPYTFKTSAFATYQLRFVDNLDPIPNDALRDFLPLRGAIGTVQGGWRYAWSQPTAMAISTEDGRIVSLVGGLIHPWLGAYALDEEGNRDGLTAVQLTAEIREYRVMPWLHNHVLAMRAATGAAIGSDKYLGLYQLGGNFGDSAFYVTPASSPMLRGFPVGADVGDAYWLTSLEYRLPLLRVDHGLLSLPAFVRAASAHVFADAGNAFSPTSWGAPLEDPLLGVGAEVRVSMILWYGVGASGRFGVATGLLGPNRIRIGEQGMAYFRVGGTF